MKKIIFTLICVSMLFIISCDINSPVVPKWDVDFTVPLMNKNYYAGDLVDSTNFFLDADSVLFFNSSGNIQGAHIEENSLKISAVEEGSGFVPILQTTDEHLITINNPEMQDDVQIVSATIKSGVIRFEFANIESELDTVHIEFQELKTPEGNVFSIDFDRSDFAQTVVDLDLNLYRFQNLTDTILSDLHFELSQKSQTSTNPILGQIKISFPNQLFFYRIRGLIHNLVIDAENYTTDIAVEYPDNIEDALQLNNPIVHFYIWNKLGYNAVFNGTLRSENSRTGEIVEYPLQPRFINAVPTIGDSVLTELTFQNSVETIMSIAPDKLVLKNANFTISNPDNVIGFAVEGDGYTGTYTATVPFDLTFNTDEPLRPKELITTSISESNQKQIKKNAKFVEFTVKLWNEFPVGAQVNLYLCSSNDKTLVYQNQEIHTDALTRVVFLNNHVTPGSLNNPSYEELTFTINEDDLALFYKYPEVNFGLQFTFDNANTQIHSTDKIKVISILKVNTTINGDENEGSN